MIALNKLTMASIIVVGAALPIGSAEAARCKQGYIYRSSSGVCQTVAAAARQGVRIKRFKHKRKVVRPAPTFEQHVANWAARHRASLIRQLNSME